MLWILDINVEYSVSIFTPGMWILSLIFIRLSVHVSCIDCVHVYGNVHLLSEVDGSKVFKRPWKDFMDRRGSRKKLVTGSTKKRDIYAIFFIMQKHLNSGVGLPKYWMLHSGGYETFSIRIGGLGKIIKISAGFPRTDNKWAFSIHEQVDTLSISTLTW